MGSEHVRNVTDLACRQALTRRGVAHVNFPVDFQSLTHEERSERNVPEHTSRVLASNCSADADGSSRSARARAARATASVPAFGNTWLSMSQRSRAAVRRPPCCCG